MSGQVFIFCVLAFSGLLVTASGGTAHGSSGAGHLDDAPGIVQRNNPSDSVLAIFFVLTLGAVLRWLNKRFVILPYTSLLFIIAYLMGMWFRKGDGGLLEAGMAVLVHIDPHLFMTVFIPPLLFLSGLEMNIKVFTFIKWQILSCAFLGTGLSVCLTALVVKAVFFWYNWSWVTCFMFGAIVSATDPVAVVALLSELGAATDLNTLIDGEAVLNDGTAAVVFFVFKDFAGGLNPGAVGVIKKIVLLTFVSPLMGVAFALGLIVCLQVTVLDRDIEVTLTLGSCYLCFWCAEEAGLSGILAVVIMSIFFKAFGRNAVSPELHGFFHSLWEWIGFVGNSLVFFTAGLLISTQAVSQSLVHWTDYIMWPVFWILLHIVRALVILLQYPILSRTGYGFPWRNAVVYWWAGLRGAIGLVLVGIVSHEEGIAPIDKVRIGIQVAGTVVMTLQVNATTMGYVYGIIGLGALSKGRKSMLVSLRRVLHRHVPRIEDQVRQLPFYSGCSLQNVRDKVKSLGRLGNDDCRTYRWALRMRTVPYEDVEVEEQVRRELYRTALTVVASHQKKAFERRGIGGDAMSSLEYGMDCASQYFRMGGYEQIFARAWQGLTHTLLVDPSGACWAVISSPPKHRIAVALEAVSCFLDSLHALETTVEVHGPNFHEQIAPQIADIRTEACVVVRAMRAAHPKDFAQAVRQQYICAVLNVLCQNVKALEVTGLIRTSDLECLDAELQQDLHDTRAAFQFQKLFRGTVYPSAEADLSVLNPPANGQGGGPDAGGQADVVGVQPTQEVMPPAFSELDELAKSLLMQQLQDLRAQIGFPAAVEERHADSDPNPDPHRSG